MIKPFSEVALFEQGNSSDPFYATGSIASIGEDPSSFSSALKNKDQIRFSFPVKNSVQMLKNSASIYYYNFTAQQWNIPSGAIPDHIGPFEKLAFKTIGGTFPGGGTAGTLFLDDQIGVDCYGNSLASGSFDRRRNNSFLISTLEQDLSLFKIDQQIKFLTADYPKSIQRNPDYDATANEVFVLSNEQPFLIEKVVFELPICCGPAWFNDRTAAALAYAEEPNYQYNGSSAFVYADQRYFWNEGGPGITVSLFSQKTYGNSKIRDLICNATITNYHDVTYNTDFVGIDLPVPGLPYVDVLSNDNYFHYLIPQTFVKASGSSLVESIIPGTGITGIPIDEYFTGSVTVRATPAISNGLKIASYGKTLGLDDPTDPNGPAVARKQFEELITSEFIDVGVLYNYGVDAYGRGMTGFSPSGASIFGKEYTTQQNKIINGKIKNPYFMPEAIEKPSLLLSLATDFENNYVTHQLACVSPPATIQQSAYSYALFTINLSEKSPSPYLVNPGEKLILSISKNRPTIKTFGVNVDAAGGDDYTVGEGTVINSAVENLYAGTEGGHDVQLTTGSINITLYGSYVRAGQEYVP